MSQQLLLGHRRMRLAVPLTGRDPAQHDRGATPLELFFDLVFVVAVALAAEGLHHGVAEAHTVEALVRFTMIFFAIYWAWVNFTWLSSAYDTDDVVFRALTFLTMTGALVFAAGVPRVMADGDFSVVVAGYTLMRVAQILTWHADHIAERYGLFMIIVLGESVLATSRAVQTALDEGAAGALAPVFVGGLLVLFSIWWAYFERPADHLGSSRWWPYAWSYLHLVMFACVAAMGAGLALVIEEAAHHGEVSATTAAAAVTVPYGLFLLSLWGMYVRRDEAAVRRFGVPVVGEVGVGELATSRTARCSPTAVGALRTSRPPSPRRSPRARRGRRRRAASRRGRGRPTATPRPRAGPTSSPRSSRPSPRPGLGLPAAAAARPPSRRRPPGPASAAPA